MNLTKALCALYNREINCEISSFWDSGWTFRIGDRANGFKAEGYFSCPDLGAKWLIEEAERIYPATKEAP